MITKKMIEDVTQVYLQSYTIALNETHNPNLAVQCATGVTMVLANILKQKPQDDYMGVFAAIMSEMIQQSQGMKKPQPKRKESEKESGDEENKQ